MATQGIDPADAVPSAATAAAPANAVAADPVELLRRASDASRADQYRVSRELVLRAAAAAGPDLPPAAMKALLRQLRALAEGEAFRALAARLLDDPRTPAAFLAESAWLLGSLNDTGLALRCAEAAVRKAPQDPAARVARGQQFAHHGRAAQAERDFDWALQRAPRIAIAWWMRSQLRRQAPGANHVAGLRALLATRGLPAADVATLARAMHKELDDLGDHAGAWQALEAMCRARRAGSNYDARQGRELVDALIAWDASAPREAAPRREGATPVFIVGMHRSGTTLLEQLLDASPQVRGVGELDDFHAAMCHATDHACVDELDTVVVRRADGVDFADVGRRYLAGMAWRLGDEPFFTDKKPSNFLNVGFILRALPNAKILHLARDPVETCFSNLRELFFGVNAWSWDQRELADWFLQYRRLMAHWHAAFPGRILDVPYAGLVRDTEATMRDVAAWCGIEHVPAMNDPRSSRRAVNTASTAQVRAGVVARDVPKWAPYARQLQPLRETLREGGAAFADVGTD
jgi:hypothetical protein